MNAAIERGKGELLSELDTKELKKMYRRIVKAIHPDLHPDMTKSQLDLFNNAVDAYANGDLNTLKIIDEMVSDPIIPDAPDAMKQFTHDKERLTKLIISIKESIEKIKSEYPYTVKDIVQDPEKIAARKIEIEETLRMV